MRSPLLPGLLLLLFTLTPFAAAAFGAEKHEIVGKIDRFDPKLDDLIAADAKIEVLASGFEWAEGPVWIKKGNFLLFSDVKKNTVFRWSEADGLSAYLKPSGYTGSPSDYKGPEPGSNGLSVDPKGNLTLCQHGDHRISRLKSGPDAKGAGEFETLADKYEGKRLNSPNDNCWDKQGNLYFTDPPYGLESQKNSDPKKELKFNGVYRVSPDKKLTLLTKEIAYPNGLALSPDQKTLYVASSDPDKAVIMTMDLTEDGAKNLRLFFDCSTQKGPGLPDGMKVDEKGNLFATAQGGLLIISKEGKLLGAIRPSDKIATANCAWGDDGSTLYMTNDSRICRIKTKTKGAGF